MFIHQKLARGYRSTAADAGSDYNELISIGSQESCHNRVILIVFGLLL